mmetsp:Transcript_36174/g.36852  ORF Transcript_36174/g.36852 Transcript_36174/m.36852 type:complete len:145 (-) Transcript_36174:262-696(-)
MEMRGTWTWRMALWTRPPLLTEMGQTRKEDVREKVKNYNLLFFSSPADDNSHSDGEDGALLSRNSDKGHFTDDLLFGDAIAETQLGFEFSEDLGGMGWGLGSSPQSFGSLRDYSTRGNNATAMCVSDVFGQLQDMREFQAGFGH